MKYVENPPTNEMIMNKEELLFDKNGKRLESSEGKVYAKHLKITFADGSKQNKFYVMCNRRELYNPLGIDSHREKTLDLNLQSVNQQTFDMYLLYLTKRNQAHFNKANRSIING